MAFEFGFVLKPVEIRGSADGSFVWSLFLRWTITVDTVVGQNAVVILPNWRELQVVSSCKT